MKLSIRDRLMLQQVLLQTQGSVVTLRVLRDLQAEIGFSEEEIAHLGLKAVDNSFQWDATKASDKEVEIGETARNAIKAELDRMSDAGSLRPPHLDLYEKFVGSDDDG